MAGFFRRSNPDVDRLAELPLLSKLSRSDLGKLAAAGQVVNLPAHWTFITEGTPGDVAYVVLSGGVRVVVQGEEVARVSVGEVIGEAGLLEGRLRNASVSTVEPTVLLHIDQPAFDRLRQQVPGFKAVVDEAAARHSR